jgi:hypothetical protein
MSVKFFDWPELYSGLDRPHPGVKATDFGKEGIFGRAIRRMHLDLAGLDEEKGDISRRIEFKDLEREFGNLEFCFTDI